MIYGLSVRTHVTHDRLRIVARAYGSVTRVLCYARAMVSGLVILADGFVRLCLGVFGRPIAWCRAWCVCVAHGSDGVRALSIDGPLERWSAHVVARLSATTKLFPMGCCAFGCYTNACPG